MPVYLSEKNFFQWPGKFLSGGRLNNFLKAACCLGLAKSFKFFHFIDDFVNFISFQYFHQLHWNAEIFQTIWASRLRLWVKSLSLNIKQYYNKTAINQMGLFIKYVTYKMTFFIPFTWVTLCQIYSITSPVLFNKSNKLWNKRKEDFLYMWLFQRIAVCQGS